MPLQAVFFFPNSGGNLTAQAVPPEIQWETTFGGDQDDLGSCVRETEGGYVVTGWTTATEIPIGIDLYLIKVDFNGELLWEKSFGGEDSFFGESLQETSGGGFFIAGSVSSLSEGSDGYILQVDSGGKLVWEKRIEKDEDESIHDLIETTDGGYLLLGIKISSENFLSDLLITKVSSQGELIWEKTFGGEGSELGRSIQATSDQNYIVAGTTDSTGAGGFDLYLIKFNAQGNLLWEKTFGGERVEVGSSVKESNGYIVAGQTNSYGSGENDIYLVKTDPDGNLLWERTHGLEKDDVASSIEVTGEGGFVIAGWTNSVGAGEYDAFLLKTDSEGHFHWVVTAGGEGDDGAHALQMTSDGGFILAGETSSSGSGGRDVFLVKFGPEPPAYQIPGDCNQDGALDLSDGICLLWALFSTSPVALPCGEGSFDDLANKSLLDSNGDEEIDLSDVLHIFGYLFLSQAPPVLGAECVKIPGCPATCPP